MSSATPLHSKLSKLELELVDAFRHPPHPASDTKLSRRLKKRFDFINNLLTLEVASTPEKTDQHDEITEKLAGLEAAFRCWTDYRTYAFNMYHDDEPLSVCSDCLEGGDDSEGPESPQLTADHFSGRKKGEDSGRNWGGFGKLIGAFGSGVIVGSVCYMAVVDLASFYLLQYHHVYFIPPT